MGFGCCGCMPGRADEGVGAEGEIGEVTLLVVEDAGVIDKNPTSSLRFAPWVPETGCGAANCVLEFVVNVDVGGGMAAILEVVVGSVDGVADWKSSKSSSSIESGESMSSPLPAGFLPAA